MVLDFYSIGFGGSTPAWAGKRQRYSSELQSVEDHPRMGGEKCIPFSKSESITGSPPRRRGKAGKNGGCDFGDRITPAWAGKSQGHRADRGAEQDHPRMGGEKAESAEPATDKQGSPPRRRGKEAVLKSAVNTSWITPAQAGKRQEPVPGSVTAEDHPRAGGEKLPR